MGSYGVGPSRLMGLIAEHFADDKGLVWPEDVAPARIYLVSIGSSEAIQHADALYEKFTNMGIEVLYDDRDVRPGQKFADGELMGIPLRVTVSDRLLEKHEYEVSERLSGETVLLTEEALFAKINRT